MHFHTKNKAFGGSSRHQIFFACIIKLYSLRILIFGYENYNINKNEHNTQIKYEIYLPNSENFCLLFTPPQRGPAVTCMLVIHKKTPQLMLSDDVSNN